jgi:hypothetical protein
MRIVKTSAAILVLALAPAVSVAAESYSDNFDRTDSRGLGQNWVGAFSEPPGDVVSKHAIPGNRAIAGASQFVRVANGSPLVVASVEFQACYLSENIGTPGLYLGINHQGGTAGTLATTDHIVIQGVGGAKFLVDGDWRDTQPLSKGLVAGNWYRMEIKQEHADFTATVTAADGTILQQNTYRSSVKTDSTGAAFIRYGGTDGTWNSSPAFDNFHLKIVHGPRQDLSMIEPSGHAKTMPLLLVSGGKPRAGIIHSDNPTQKVHSAANRLQDYMKRMTGVWLPIGPLSKATGIHTRILVGPDVSELVGIPIPQTYPGGERVILKTVASDIVLAGNDAGAYMGTRHAVDMFLEDLGCEWFGSAPHWHVVAKLDELSVDKTDIDTSPAFGSRSGVCLWQYQVAGGNNPDFDRHCWGSGGVPIQMNHSYYPMFPPDQFAKDHPEYYAEVGGKRIDTKQNVGDGQICFSNRDVLAHVVELAREHFDKDPTQVMFSVNPNDCGGFCECAACSKLGENAGAKTLSFANSVVKELRRTHPEKYVAFDAYWFCHAAPAKLKSEPGVIVFAVNSTCKAHSLDAQTCPGKKAWMDNLQKWKATGADVSIYEWYLPSLGGWQHIPWIPGDTSLCDLRYYRANGVKYLFYESYGDEVLQDAPLRWPLAYVVARGMWNPDLTAEQILKPACQKLFGEAAASMLAFYMECAKDLDQCPLHAVNWGLPNPRSVYTPEAIAKLDGYLAESSQKAENGQPEARQRIQDTVACWNKAKEAIRAAKPITSE